MCLIRPKIYLYKKITKYSHLFSSISSQRKKLYSPDVVMSLAIYSHSGLTGLLVYWPVWTSLCINNLEVLKYNNSHTNIMTLLARMQISDRIIKKFIAPSISNWTEYRVAPKLLVGVPTVWYQSNFPDLCVTKVLDSIFKGKMFTLKKDRKEQDQLTGPLL